MLKLIFLGVVAIAILRLWRPPVDVGGPEDDTDDEDVDLVTTRQEGFTPATQGASRATMMSTDPAPPPRSNDFTPDPDVLTGKNFLDASRWTGLNTVAGARRNSSYDIRENLVVPKQAISPFGQSTIEADLLRRPIS